MGVFSGGSSGASVRTTGAGPGEFDRTSRIRPTNHFMASPAQGVMKRNMGVGLCGTFVSGILKDAYDIYVKLHYLY